MTNTRLIANENIPYSVIARLREIGFDVLSVKESMPGATDAEVVSRAQSDARVSLTQDKDFGELAFRHQRSGPGVILFRLHRMDRNARCDRMVAVISSRSDWHGHFSIVDDRHIRMRSIPDVSSE